MHDTVCDTASPSLFLETPALLLPPGLLLFSLPLPEPLPWQSPLSSPRHSLPWHLIQCCGFKRCLYAGHSQIHTSWALL